LRLLTTIWALLVALLAGLAAMPATAQVIYGGAAIIVVPGMYYWPRIPYAYVPYATFRDEALYFEGAGACLRIGRCSMWDVYLWQGRLNRLQRLAPSAPFEEPWQTWARLYARPRAVEPTPVENITPAYQSASQVRPEYLEAGKPLER
jgi:hypothetical protein